VNLTVEKLEPRHAAIVPYLRGADLDELRDGIGVSPAWGVAYSIACCRPGYAAIVDSRRGAGGTASGNGVQGSATPAALFGIGPSLEKGTGVPWLLATEEIERHPVTFYRVSKRLFPKVAAGYDRLVNWVDARNTLSLRWLVWLGLTMEPAAPFGVLGLDFHRMVWEAK
jgi:hypothetical protein